MGFTNPWSDLSVKKLFKRDSIVIDDFVFRLHHQVQAGFRIRVDFSRIRLRDETGSGSDLTAKPDPDPTFEKTPEPTSEIKPNSDSTFEQIPDPNPDPTFEKKTWVMVNKPIIQRVN